MLGEAAAYVRNDRFRSFHQSSRHRELAVSVRNHVAGQADPETVRKSAFKLREPLIRREGALLFYGHDRNQARDIRYARSPTASTAVTNR
jgi:hypothetical protein